MSTRYGYLRHGVVVSCRASSCSNRDHDPPRSIVVVLVATALHGIGCLVVRCHTQRHTLRHAHAPSHSMTDPISVCIKTAFSFCRRLFPLTIPSCRAQRSKHFDGYGCFDGSAAFVSLGALQQPQDVAGTIRHSHSSASVFRFTAAVCGLLYPGVAPVAANWSAQSRLLFWGVGGGGTQPLLMPVLVLHLAGTPNHTDEGRLAQSS